MPNLFMVAALMLPAPSMNSFSIPQSKTRPPGQGKARYCRDLNV